LSGVVDTLVGTRLADTPRGAEAAIWIGVTVHGCCSVA
jgi:hypothetical protein